MKLISPSGHKIIEILKDYYHKIYIEDFSPISTKFQLDIFLKKDNAQIEIQGRINTKHTNYKQWIIKIYFLGKNQTCFLNLKGIAENNSQLEFDGGAILSSQSNNSQIKIKEQIVLFDQSTGKCLPSLNVQTNQVKKASHSASIAPFNKEMILFTNSRGIPKKEAIEMFKNSFLLSNFSSK